MSLNQGWEIEINGHRERGPTTWPADDLIAQTALFIELARRIDDGTTGLSPTRIEQAAAAADVIFATFESVAQVACINLT